MTGRQLGQMWLALLIMLAFTAAPQAHTIGPWVRDGWAHLKLGDTWWDLLNGIFDLIWQGPPG